MLKKPFYAALQPQLPNRIGAPVHREIENAFLTVALSNDAVTR
jgi:hypothetical protein